MDLLKLFNGGVGINLRDGEVLVPQQFLYGDQTRAFVQKMRGKGVAQYMMGFSALTW